MKKKCAIIFLTIFISLIAAINFSVAIKAREQVNYETSITSKETIKSITINNTKMPLSLYLNDNLRIEKQPIKNQEDVLEEVIVTENYGTITFSTSVIDKVLINYGGNLENVKIYVNGEEKILDGSIYSNNMNIFDTISICISWNTLLMFVGFLPVMTLLIYYIEKFIKILKDNTQDIWHILLFVCAVFLLYFFMFYILLYTLRLAIVLIIMAILGYGIYYLRDTVKEHIENLYVLIVTVAGITMLFIIPPFNVPDEMAHFIKSFELTYISNIDNGYINLPLSIEELRDKYESDSYIGSTKYNGKNYFSDMLRKGEYNVLSDNVSSYNNTKNASAIPYIPSAITIFLARIFGLSPLMLLLFGRFTNLLITVICCYLAIKHIPCFKKVLFIVVLFPIYLHQAAALNMDWLTNVITVLIICFVFKYKKSKEIITKRQEILLASLGILLAFCKFGYFPILMSILLIPNCKFKNKKMGIIFKTLFIIVPSFISYLQNTGLGMPKGENPFYTISYTFEHPIDAIKVYFRTAFARLPLDIFRGLFDGFGVSTKWHSSLVLYILIIIYTLLILSSCNDEETELTKKDRSILIIIAVMIIGIIYTAMYLNWTKIGSLQIDGLQPRYFIPPALLLYISISNNRIYMFVKNKNLIYSIGVYIVYILSFTTIVRGFY